MFDWAGMTDLQKMRQASTETVFALPTIYHQVNNAGQQQFGGFGGMMRMGYMPMIDGYVSLKSFDDATREGTLADVPYMIGFTLNDMGNMATARKQLRNWASATARCIGRSSNTVLCSSSA